MSILVAIVAGLAVSYALLLVALAHVLDDGELQGHAHLGRRQAHARRVAHRLAHELVVRLGRGTAAHRRQ